MIKLYIPNNQNYIGGPKTFLINLKKYLQLDKDINLVDREIDSNVILFPVEYPIESLKELKNRRIKIIQRLDGVFYPSKHTPKQLEFNETMKEIYLNYADHIVFQSEYSKKQCFNTLGVKNKKSYDLIINGVDKEIFKPKDKKFNKDKIQFITTGNFRNEDMLIPIINSLELLKDKYSFELLVVGKISNENILKAIGKEYIRHIDEVNILDISKYLSKSDIFLYSFINPVCPNSVIEAISTGLPVVGLNSGAMSELLFFNKELLTYVSDDLFQKEEDIDINKFSKTIEECINNYEKYKSNALNYSHLYSMQDCAIEYSRVIKKVVNNRFNIFNLFK